MDAFVEATNAAVGSATSKVIVYPLDIIKTRMATKGCSFQEAVADLKKEGNGFVGLYKGLSMKLVKSVTGKFFYFYIYSTLSSIRLAQLRKSSNNDSVALGTASNLVIGYLSEFLELPLIMPLEALVSRVQLNQDPSASALTIARRVLKEEGVGAFFVSLDAYLLGALQPAVQMSVFDQLRPLLLQARGAAHRDLNALEAFFLGMFASSIAVTATYPMDVVRTKQQAGSKLGDQEKHPSFVQALGKILKEEGLQGAFRGLTPQLSQAVLSTAIMFMVKEKVKSYTTRILLALLALFGLRKKGSGQARI